MSGTDPFDQDYERTVRKLEDVESVFNKRKTASNEGKSTSKVTCIHIDSLILNFVLN